MHPIFFWVYIYILCIYSVTVLPTYNALNTPQAEWDASATVDPRWIGMAVGLLAPAPHAAAAIQSFLRSAQWLWRQVLDDPWKLGWLINWLEMTFLVALTRLSTNINHLFNLPIPVGSSWIFVIFLVWTLEFHCFENAMCVSAVFFLRCGPEVAQRCHMDFQMGSKTNSLCRSRTNKKQRPGSCWLISAWRKSCKLKWMDMWVSRTTFSLHFSICFVLLIARYLSWEFLKFDSQIIDRHWATS